METKEMMFLLLISFAVLFLVMELRYHPITRQGVLRTLNIHRLGFEVLSQLLSELRQYKFMNVVYLTPLQHCKQVPLYLAFYIGARWGLNSKF